jgi:hypothetical protein
MTISLDSGTIPEGLCTSAQDEFVAIGDYRLSYSDFCFLTMYVMTNTNLRLNDPRVKLLNQMKELTKVVGYDDVGFRLELRPPKNKEVRYYVVDNNGSYVTWYDPDLKMAETTDDYTIITNYNIDLASAVLNCPYGFRVRCIDRNGKILGEIPK